MTSVPMTQQALVPPQNTVSDDDIPVGDEGGFVRPLAPAGQFVAVCYDVADIGEIKTQFGSKHKVLIDYQLPVNDPATGLPYTCGMTFTKSMNEKANLRKHMETWRGRPYTEEQIKARVPIGKMKGVPALITITHKTQPNGKTYANIIGVSMVPEQMRNMVPAIDPRLKTWKQRKEEKQARMGNGGGVQPQSAGPGAPGVERAPWPDQPPF
jgi:hypothetical protein